MTPTADDVTVTVPHVWHACNPTDAHRLARPIEGHAGQNGTESQGRRNVVRKREGAKCVVSFQIFADSVQNELAFGVVELHPGHAVKVRVVHDFRLEVLRAHLVRETERRRHVSRQGKRRTAARCNSLSTSPTTPRAALRCRW
jgi:hypothetical protein